MKKREEQPEERDERRQYEAPEVRTEEVFETLALTCTKAAGQCPPTPGTSVVRS
jgi:hypothetical protein